MTTPDAARPRVTLSTSSVYPLKVEAAFETAARLGYDGVEVMVLADPVTQDVARLREFERTYGVPILSLHAPTLLVTQRAYGTTDPWVKLDRTVDLAKEIGCESIVLHPPFRWQRQYAAGFVEGVARMERERDIVLAVENMFPWRAGGREVKAYLPTWDPVPQAYRHVTLDLSHAATARSDVLAMQAALGDRLAHVHLADGSGSFTDEHLVPGRGTQPCGEFLTRLGASGFTGVVAVEVSTRRGGGANRDADLAGSLEFARTHLEAGRPGDDGAGPLA
ncbi:sugar phosphate isomerase/epimerase family protein [Agilicoccus flavus]|uniref:sugar phosphate isomerase/epimerase family protein n=1 Tax=Agilicoccus flavus TaxID=2775968 RepID=UPI001CF6915E|nr:sugar phosphate isomerase/epimerase [Agilicoccus flavus]